MEQIYHKIGYLNNDFRIFHLTDTSIEQFEFHYHDFHKILIFVSGNVSYIVEGRQYDLQPFDTILIQAGEIHKPVIHSRIPYERIILYVSPRFFDDYRESSTDLFYCFDQSRRQQSNLIRIADITATKLHPAIYSLSQSLEQHTYGTELYQRVKLIEYLILLNRTVIDENLEYTTAITANSTVLNIMKYINSHLTNELSIDIIANNMYLNRSYIMHLFKEETGYTIGRYITEKRLFLAKHYIQEGIPVTQACYQSGFRNYSAFYHAYKSKYHASPKTSCTQR